jgi:hypothetical protein
MYKKIIKTYQLLKEDSLDEDLLIIAAINDANIVWKDESKPSMNVRSLSNKKKYKTFINIYKTACLENATLVWEEDFWHSDKETEKEHIEKRQIKKRGFSHCAEVDKSRPKNV